MNNSTNNPPMIPVSAGNGPQDSAGNIILGRYTTACTVALTIFIIYTLGWFIGMYVEKRTNALLVYGSIWAILTVFYIIAFLMIVRRNLFRSTPSDEPLKALAILRDKIDRFRRNTYDPLDGTDTNMNYIAYNNFATSMINVSGELADMIDGNISLYASIREYLEALATIRNDDKVWTTDLNALIRIFNVMGGHIKRADAELAVFESLIDAENGIAWTYYPKESTRTYFRRLNERVPILQRAINKVYTSIFTADRAGRSIAEGMNVMDPRMSVIVPEKFTERAPLMPPISLKPGGSSTVAAINYTNTAPTVPIVTPIKPITPEDVQRMIEEETKKVTAALKAENDARIAKEQAERSELQAQLSRTQDAIIRANADRQAANQAVIAADTARSAANDATTAVITATGPVPITAAQITTGTPLPAFSLSPLPSTTGSLPSAAPIDQATFIAIRNTVSDIYMKNNPNAPQADIERFMFNSDKPIKDRMLTSRFTINNQAQMDAVATEAYRDTLSKMAVEATPAVVNEAVAVVTAAPPEQVGVTAVEAVTALDEKKMSSADVLKSKIDKNYLQWGDTLARAVEAEGYGNYVVPPNKGSLLMYNNRLSRLGAKSLTELGTSNTIRLFNFKDPSMSNAEIVAMLIGPNSDLREHRNMALALANSNVTAENYLQWGTQLANHLNKKITNWYGGSDNITVNNLLRKSPSAENVKKYNKLLLETPAEELNKLAQQSTIRLFNVENPSLPNKDIVTAIINNAAAAQNIQTATPTNMAAMDMPMA